MVSRVTVVFIIIYHAERNSFICIFFFLFEKTFKLSRAKLWSYTHNCIFWVLHIYLSTREKPFSSCQLWWGTKNWPVTLLFTIIRFPGVFWQDYQYSMTTGKYFLKTNPIVQSFFWTAFLECKSRQSRNTSRNRQIWPWSTKRSRSKVKRVLPRERTGHRKHLLPTTQEKTLHMDITRRSVLKSDWLYSLQPKMEKLYTVSINKTRSWLTQIMNSLLWNSDLNWRK